jgi:hypothetical protein
MLASTGSLEQLWFSPAINVTLSPALEDTCPIPAVQRVGHVVRSSSVLGPLKLINDTYHAAALRSLDAAVTKSSFSLGFVLIPLLALVLAALPFVVYIWWRRRFLVFSVADLRTLCRKTYVASGIVQVIPPDTAFGAVFTARNHKMFDIGEGVTYASVPYVYNFRFRSRHVKNAFIPIGFHSSLEVDDDDNRSTFMKLGALKVKQVNLVFACLKFNGALSSLKKWPCLRPRYAFDFGIVDVAAASNMFNRSTALGEAGVEAFKRLLRRDNHSNGMGYQSMIDPLHVIKPLFEANILSATAAAASDRCSRLGLDF